MHCIVTVILDLFVLVLIPMESARAQCLEASQQTLGKITVVSESYFNHTLMKLLN